MCSVVLICSCASPKNDLRVPSYLKDRLSNPVEVEVTKDNIPVYAGTPNQVVDVLKRGEKVTLEWLGDDLNGELYVLTSRRYFGTIDGSALKIPLSRQELDAMLEHNLYWRETGIDNFKERREFGRLFYVRSESRACDLFTIENPERFFVIDSYQCDGFSEGDTGRGWLGNLGIQSVYFGKKLCQIKVVKSFQDKNSAEDYRKKSCN